MRPDIDVPWSTHGKVKDYAEEKGISVSEAYKIILEKGLDAIHLNPKG